MGVTAVSQRSPCTSISAAMVLLVEPECAPTCRGVLPVDVSAVTSAPAAHSAVTAPARDNSAAMWRAVFPANLCFKLTCAFPLLTSSWMIDTWPWAAAVINAVAPFRAAPSTSMPLSPSLKISSTIGSHPLNDAAIRTFVPSSAALVTSSSSYSTSNRLYSFTSHRVMAAKSFPTADLACRAT